MPFCRRAFLLAFMVWLLTLCPSAFAQQWVGDLRLVNVTPNSISNHDYPISSLAVILPAQRQAYSSLPKMPSGDSRLLKR